MFHETDFPFKTTYFLNDTVDMFPNSILPIPSPLHFVDSMPLPSMHSDCSVHNTPASSSTNSYVVVEPETQNNDANVDHLARPKRTTKAPNYLSEYMYNLVPFISTSKHISSSTHDHVPVFPTLYPISSVLSYDSFSPSFQVYTLAYTLEREPKNFKQAMTSDVWKKSENVELDALEQNRT